MFNPRPSSGISHSFSKSSSKLDAATKEEPRNLSALEQSLATNLQDPSFSATKFRGNYVGLAKRADELLRDAKPKQNKGALDFESNYSNSSMEALLGTKPPSDAGGDGVFEKHQLLRLIFTLDRLSKLNGRSMPDPLQFHSVDITAFKEQDPFFDKNDKMRKMLYKPTTTKRTFFENQSRMLKGTRTFGMRGLFREEDMGHETLEGDKSFDVFDMRKAAEVKYKESYSVGYGFKDTNKEYRDGVSNDIVRQFSRDTADHNAAFTASDDQSDITRQFSRDPSDPKKAFRDSKSGELTRMLSRESNSPVLTRQFGAREDAEITRQVPKEEASSDLSRHLHADAASAELTRERSSGDLARQLSAEAARHSFRDSFRALQAEREEFQSASFLAGNAVVGAAMEPFKEFVPAKDPFKDAYKESHKQFKEPFDPTSFYKDKEKEDGDQSFLERLLDRPFETSEAVESEVMGFQQTFADNRKLWNDLSFQWQYMDPQGMVHGPFSSDQMYHWYLKNFFPQHLRMRYNTQMAWVPFRDLFPANSVPFKTPPKQFATPATPAVTPTLSMSNLNAATGIPSANAAIPPKPPMMPAKDAWGQPSENLLGSPKSTFSSTDKSASPSTNLLAPSNLLNANKTTSLLGPPAPSSLLGSTNLLAPSNLLGANSLLNPAPSSMLLGPSQGAPSLLGPSPMAGGLLDPPSAAPSLLGPSAGASTTGLLNNRLDNLWNAQNAVHPISSINNLNIGMSNMSLAFPQLPTNHMNKLMPSSGSLTQSSSNLSKQMQTPAHVSPRESVPKRFSQQGQKQFAATPAAARAAAAAAPQPAAPAPPAPSNERKWNTPQVEVNSLLEIMELEKKWAQERTDKSPPKPVQTGWNLSNVGTNNLSESDDFPSLSTVTGPTPAASAAAASSAKKVGKQITMPLETFIEKHPLTSPPQFTESFSSKLLGNKH